MTTTTSTNKRTALVSADWLAEHLRDPGVRVVEVDVSPAAYADGHIDGAVLWNIYADLKDPEYRTVPPAAIAGLLSRSGITPDSTVVCYGYGPALGVWLLALHGHADARILDCSREAWRADGHPWTTSAGSPPAVDRYRLGAPDARIRACRSDVCAAITDPRVTPGRRPLGSRVHRETVLALRRDGAGRARRARPHCDPSAPRPPRGRRVRGPVRPRGAFRSPAELRRVFSSVDLDGDDELITYCTIGGRAASAWFVLTRLLGRDNVRVYDGSWAEWGRRPDTPVQSDIDDDRRYQS